MPGGRGDDGQDANLSGNSRAITLITQGGNGGAGGPGSAQTPTSTSISPGTGGNGGNATADAEANNPIGPVSATATAVGGLGGSGGSGADSSQSRGANGSDGTAYAHANASGQDRSTVSASANATGETASVNAYGQSNGGGTVNVSASLTQNGDIFLSNAVDGQTTGALFLTQSITARADAAAGSSAGDAFNSLSENRNSLTLLSASLAATGANGGSLSTPGGGAVTNLSLFSVSPIIASETATGGDGGNDGTSAYWGMTGMVQANISASGNPNGLSSASLDAHAIGGSGASAGALRGNGGFGGSASAQLSVFAPGNATLHLTLTPGNGGAGVGSNSSGGMGGYVDIGNVSVVSASADADLAVTLKAGNGGDGINGASAANGSDAMLYNVGNISAMGTLLISQTAVAGNGGSVRSDTLLGMAGNGGNAYSTLSRTDTDNPLVVLNASATGGNGGDLGGAGTTYFAAGAAGLAKVSIDDSSNRSIRAVGQSFGGNAGADHGSLRLPGGQAYAAVNATSDGSVIGDFASTSASATGGTGNGSPDSTQSTNSSRAFATSTANGHASAIAAASAIGGGSALGRGGDASADATATLNGDGTSLNAIAVAVGGDGGGPYFTYYAGGNGISDVSINSPSGTASGESSGGRSTLPMFLGGEAIVNLTVGTVYVSQIAEPIGQTGGHAKIIYANGQFTALAVNQPQLGIFGTGSLTATAVTGVATLSVGGDAVLNLAAGHVEEDATALAFYQNGKLNLTDNTLRLDNGTAASTHLADTRSELAAGQIFSSSADALHTLGYAASGTALTVKLALAGDANLDGKVDIADLGLLATRYGQSGFWTDGDFNYDGTINIADLGLLATTYGSGATTPLAMSFQQALAHVQQQTGVELPEPGMALLVVAGPLLTRRRRT